MLTPQELTWIATLFDCEGCLSSPITYVKKNGDVSTYVWIQIGHRSKDVIDRLDSLLPGWGRTYTHEYNYKYKETDDIREVYWWKITNRRGVRQFIELIWGEWLSEYRRETAIRLGVAPMARTSQSLKHTHQYYRVEMTGLWHCANCTHFMPGNMPPPAGRMSICWRCEKPFQLTPANMADDKPVCDNCTGERQSFNLDDYIAEQTRKRKQALAEGHDKDCEAYLGGECHCTIVQPDQIETYDPDDDVDTK